MSPAQLPARLKSRLPADVRFRVNRSLLDTRVMGDFALRARSSLQPFRADRATGLVVDGFPRSANTYAYYAMKLACGDTVRVRGHTHSVRNLVYAVRRDIPTILLVRDPRDTVASLVQLVPGLSLATAAAAYSRFYRSLLPLVDGLVVAKFDDVISDLASVVHRVNQKFDSSLPAYVRSDANESKVRRIVEENSRLRSGGAINEAGVARPSPERRTPTEVMSVLDAGSEDALGVAREIYDAVLHHS